MAVEERVWSPTEILLRYQRGERDFRSLDISDPEGVPAAFAGASLDGADFSHAFIVADFRGASLSTSRFVAANVKTCQFDGANLTAADFTDASIDGATFAGAKMEGATFLGAGWYDHTLKPGQLPD